MRPLWLALSLLLLGGGALACSPEPELAERASIAPCYLSEAGGQLNIGTGCTLAVADGGAWATSVPIAGVTGTAIAPYGRLQPVAMATAGTVPVTIPDAGEFVCVWNTGTEAITIADTGNQVLSGDATLGQYDTLCFVSDGTRLIEVSQTDN